MNENEINSLSEWVKQGGTLIAHNGSSRFIASEDALGDVKLLQDTFDDMDSYNLKLLREIYSLDSQIDKQKVNSNKVDAEISYPWEDVEGLLSKDELIKRDKYQSIFMPSGAIVSGRLDEKHWLTFGSGKTMPLLYSNYPILMTNKAEAPIRVGEFVDNNEESLSRSINWSFIPKGKDLNVRMSGLVWPEASQRISNSAYLTRERLGKGQIILFSGEPNFRGASLGTNRVWLNAVVYGAGLGTSSRINL
jgi:hypothetical protein